MGKTINDRQTSQLYHTAGTELPKPAMLEEGELAANISTGQTELYIKDVEDNIHVFKDSSYNDDRYVINGENPKTVDIKVTGDKDGSVREIKIVDSDDTGNTSSGDGITISDKSRNELSAKIEVKNGYTAISALDTSGKTESLLEVGQNGAWYKNTNGISSEVTTHKAMRYTRARLSEKKNKADEELIPSHSTLQDARVKIGNFIYVSNSAVPVTCYIKSNSDSRNGSTLAIPLGILYEIASFNLSGNSINTSTQQRALSIKYDSTTSTIGISETLKANYVYLGENISNCKIVIEITGANVQSNTNKIYYGALTDATVSDGYYQFALPAAYGEKVTYRVYVTLPISRFRDGILYNKNIDVTNWNSWTRYRMFKKNTSNQWVKVKKNDMMFRVTPDFTDEWKPQHIDYVDANDIELDDLATAIATPKKYQVWFRVTSGPGYEKNAIYHKTDTHFKWRLCGRKMNGEIKLSYLPTCAQPYFDTFNAYQEVYYDDMDIYADEQHTTNIEPATNTLYKDITSGSFYYLPQKDKDLVCVFDKNTISDNQYAQLEKVICYHGKYVKKNVKVGSSVKGLYTYSETENSFVPCNSAATAQNFTDYFEYVYSADGGLISPISAKNGALDYIKRCFKRHNRRTGDVSDATFTKPIYIDFAIFKVKNYRSNKTCNHRVTTENIGKVYRVYWAMNNHQEKARLSGITGDDRTNLDAVEYNRLQREFFKKAKFLRTIPAFKNRKK